MANLLIAADQYNVCTGDIFGLLAKALDFAQAIHVAKGGDHLDTLDTQAGMYRSPAFQHRA